MRSLMMLSSLPVYRAILSFRGEKVAARTTSSVRYRSKPAVLTATTFSVAQTRSQ